MKLLFDLFPIILFFVAYKTYDIFVATAVAIGAAVVQVLWHYIQHKSFERTHVITLIMLAVFGGLTIVLRDPEFVMWKVSVINLLFALVFFGSFFVGDKTIIERMMGSQVTMPKPAWNKLNGLWVLLFVVIAAVNVYFVLPALKARDALLGVYNLAADETVKSLDCANHAVAALCTAAQQTEESWVNFKLFGTMGLTLVFVVITVVVISRYIKEDGN